MNIEPPNEKKGTRYTFEQTYFTNDAMKGNNNYTFQFPETWSGLPTKWKAVGFRYAKLKINSYYIAFQFCLLASFEGPDGSSGGTGPLGSPNGEIKLAVTNENTVEEVVHEITKQMNIIISKFNENVIENSEHDRFKNSEIVGICGASDLNDGSLTVTWASRGSYTPSGRGTTTKYRIYMRRIDDYEKGVNDFCEFFNQNLNELGGICGSYSSEVVLKNVWDRQTLYIHSDIVFLS